MVDTWKELKASQTIEARLITIDEVSNLGYEWKQTCPTCNERWVITDSAPNWIYNSKYSTMSSKGDSSSSIWCVNLYNDRAINTNGGSSMVRPVLELNKFADITLLSD